MRFPRWTERDPKIVTPLPFRDLRDQELIDAALEQRWRAGVRRREESRPKPQSCSIFDLPRYLRPQAD